jgi:hypothetical protein
MEAPFMPGIKTSKNFLNTNKMSTEKKGGTHTITDKKKYYQDLEQQARRNAEEVVIKFRFNRSGDTGSFPSGTPSEAEALRKFYENYQFDEVTIINPGP